MRSLSAAVFLPPETSEAMDPTTPVVMYKSVRVLHAALTAAGRPGLVPLPVPNCVHQCSPDLHRWPMKYRSGTVLRTQCVVWRMYCQHLCYVQFARQVVGCFGIDFDA
jgi:hypothetical protein